MLSPKRTKFRKMQKGNNRGLAGRGCDVAFGDFADTMERSDPHPRCGVLWLSPVRRPHQRPPGGC